MPRLLNAVTAGSLSAATVWAIDPTPAWWVTGVAVAVVLVLEPPRPGCEP